VSFRIVEPWCSCEVEDAPDQHGLPAVTVVAPCPSHRPAGPFGFAPGDVRSYLPGSLLDRAVRDARARALAIPVWTTAAEAVRDAREREGSGT
jgi:hypothetical protein